MKKQLFSFLILSVFSFHFLQAQTEIKISPVGLIAGVIAVSIEQGISDDFGVEADFYGAFDAGGALIVSAKYYFNPQRGLDRFHAGIYAGGISDTGAGVGFLVGTKIISKKNILFELGFGLGRTFDDGFLPYGKLHIGYRFGRK